MPDVTQWISVAMLALGEASPNGIDPGTFWLIVTALGGTVTTLAGIIYKGEVARRKAAEAKLEAYEKLAPDVVAEVRRLGDLIRASSLADDEVLDHPLLRRPR